MPEGGVEEIKRFHEECDHKFIHLVFVKQKFAEVYGKYFAVDPLRKLTDDEAKHIVLELSSGPMQDYFGKIQGMPRSKVSDGEANSLVREIWGLVEDVVSTYNTQVTGRLQNASCVPVIYRSLQNAEFKFKNLLGCVNRMIETEL